MSHVAPHRWADAAAGRVPAEERARMGAHAASCPRCAAGRDRVTSAREAFGDIARAPAPELRWEQVGARVYWAASQERRSRERTAVSAPRRRWLWLAPAVLAAGGAAVYLAVREPDAAPTPIAATTPPKVLPDHITPIELVEAPTALTGLVTLSQGEVIAAGPVFSTPVVAGSAIETRADGRVAVQLDGGTAFALGPDSRLVVARLDSRSIDLQVDGEISVEVTRRAADQRFTVTAGGRVVEVRGTAFEVVHRDGALQVACRHGVVAVRDVIASSASAPTIEVTAGTLWSAPDGAAIAPSLAPLDDATVDALMARAPALLPAWTDAETMLRTTGPVDVRAGKGHAIRVDGVPVGVGALTVRAMSGRHLVEAERAPGKFAAGEWVETGTRIVIASTTPAPSKRAGVATRRRQLEDAVDARRLANCVRDLSRQGLSDGTHVELSIGVDGTGAVSFLNVGDTDLPAATAACVRDVIATVTFPAGPAATWRHRVSF